MKKILSLVLAMLMIFSVVPAVFAADAKAEDAHQEALDFLSLIGLYKGGVDASEKLTRWQMALFVSRFITGKLDDAYWATTENDSGFADVAEFLDKDMKYVVGAVSFAAQQGIINGYGDGNFGPNDGITYRDALVMVVRALGTTYGTAGYPWSYVKTAGDWGLTAGLESVGHMDQLTRAQVAQILYNALFVEVEGATVAEKVFGVATDVVIITASNDVKLNEKDAVVVRDGFVQFAVADAEGAPSGTKYHIAAADLGITDANAAVGTAYEVTYVNNFATILKSESLNTTYTNYGGTNEIAISSGTITLDGVKTTMVDKYTALNNLQGTDNKTGMLESKVYASATSSLNLGTMGNTYYMDDQGYIYNYTNMQLVAYYSVFFDKMYGAALNDHGVVTFTAEPANKAEIEADLTLGGGQYTLTTAATDTAYAKAVASDLDGDGVYDRVMLRNYQFGTFTLAKDQKSFTLTKGATTNSLTAVSGTFKTANDSNAVKVNQDYRFTGVALSEFTKEKTYYVLYYIDTVNYEIDVLEVIGQTGVANAADGKTNYVAKGYLLGFHQTNNLIYINDGVDKIKTLTIGYADMAGAPIQEFKADLTKPANVTYNESLIAEFLEYQNMYVEYVVVAGKMVYLAGQVAASSDVVVIDYFTNISEDGIEAYAWSTATNSYEIIKIAEFNGWNVGGFDWRDYYFNSIFGGFNGALGGTTNLETLLPVKAGEIYKVVYRNDNAYNLTDATYTTATVEVANAYVHTVSGTTVTKVAATTANDYWVIRQVKADGTVEKIYTRTGAMATLSLPDVDIYKKANNDYVISGTAAELAALNNAIFLEGDVKFMYYKKLVGYYDTDYMWDGQGYYYGHWMKDVITGTDSFVKYEAAKWQTIKAAVEAGLDGKVYMVIDGFLSEANALAPKSMADVARYLINSKAYKGLSVAAPKYDAFDAATIVADVRDLVEAELGYTYASSVEYIKNTAVTIVGISGGAYYKLAGDKTTDLNNAFGILADITAYTLYTEAGEILVLMDAAKLEVAKEVKVDFVGKYFTTLPVTDTTAWQTAKDATDFAGKYANSEVPFAVTWIYKESEKTLTLNVALNGNSWSSRFNGYSAVTNGTTPYAGLVVMNGDTKMEYATHTILNADKTASWPFGKSYIESFTLTFENVTAVPEELVIWMCGQASSTERSAKVTIDMK